LAEERGLGHRVTFQCADMVSTGFEEASFDVVWNIESLCHVLDPEDYVAHVLELLRDGGRFVCVDLLRAEGSSPGGEHERQACDGWAMPPLRMLSELRGMVERAGFEQVEAIDLTARSLLPAQALKAGAHNAMLLIRAEKAILNEERPLYEGHVRGGYAFAEGLLQGTLAIGYVGGVRPARGR
jgi:SAM-dependent methyltransferase